MRTVGRHPVAFALATALLGLGVGVAARYTLTGGPAPTWVASLEASVVDVQLDPTGAHAVIDVTVVTGEPAVTVASGFGTGAGLAPSDRPVPVTLVPRADADESSPLVRQRRLTVPLHCADIPAGAGPSRITLALTTSSGDRHEVSAATGSGLTGPSDLCSTADGVLPSGWEHPITVTAFTPDPADPRTARLTVPGFAPNAQVVPSFASASAVADRITVDQPDSRGAVTVTVHLSDDCQEDGGPVPVGLTLSVTTTAGTTYHYAAVGIEMVRWILHFRSTHCRAGVGSQPLPLYRVADGGWR